MGDRGEIRPGGGLGMDTTRWLATDKAHRQIATGNRPYQDVLATVSGLESKPIKPPRLPNAGIEPSTTGGIVICLFEAYEAFKLPWTVKKAIIKHCTTYGVPVYLLGRPGQRADYSPFTEGSILSDRPLQEKLEALASARLVLGVPNEWTWLATAWDKKVIVLHPDDMPHERWFGFDVAPRTLARLLVTWSQLQIPVILAGLRRLIEIM